jgi:hypothetical protein
MKLAYLALVTASALSIPYNVTAHNSPTDLAPIFEHFVKHRELPEMHPSHQNITIDVNEITYPDTDGTDHFQRQLTALMLLRDKKLIAAVPLSHLETELRNYIGGQNLDEAVKLELLKEFKKLQR